MNTNNSDSPQAAIAALLTTLFNQPIPASSIHPVVVYLSALAAVLTGVAHADSQITEAERSRLKHNLAQFIPKGSTFDVALGELMQGVRASKIYAKPADIATLMSLCTESERLLLVGLGYDLAIADQDLNPKEQKYLRLIAQQFGLQTEWLAALEMGLLHQQAHAALAEVCALLDPARFQGLDPVFAKAANQILLQLPEQPKPDGVSLTVGYETLGAFQAQQQQLHQVCETLQTEIAECGDRLPIPNDIATELQAVTERLNSQRFRVAVVGEFSQGKSTLLNALLGEEIQPTRVIPCSGSITVLRHGKQKQVICHYRSGQSATIPLEEYQAKAAIPEAIALGDRATALTSDVLELIYEHPGLELCRQGVELLDSPGLNEHPERTRITHQLLQNVDAVIFLANASRPMTQGERELLESLRAQLNQGATDRPADNLFVLVNFMDLVRRERDRQQVQQLVENFLLGEAPILASPRQLHFISAQAALEAIIDGDEHSDYLQTFRDFTQELQSFLTQTRGESILRQIKTRLRNLIQTLALQLAQAENTLQGKINIPDPAKQNILNQMGEVSGYQANLQLLIETLSQKKREEVKKLKLCTYLDESIRRKSTAWSSTHTDKNKIAAEFFDKFQTALMEAIEAVRQNLIVDEILTPALKDLDSRIQTQISEFYKSVKAIDQATGSQLTNQVIVSLSQSAPQFQFKPGEVDSWETVWNAGIGGISGLGGGGLLAGGIALGVSSIAFFPVVLTTGAIAGIAAGGAALGTAIGGALGFFGPPDQFAIKEEVIESAFKQFYYEQQGPSQLMSAFDIGVKEVFEQQLSLVQNITQQHLAILNTLLMEAAAAHTATLEQSAIACSWYAAQRMHLNEMQAHLS